MLRRTCVYERRDGWKAPVEASIEYGRYFENLFKNIGVVRMGFPEQVDYAKVANRGEYEPENVKEYMMFGTPDEVIGKLKFYEQCGVENFCYGASFGLRHELTTGARSSCSFARSCRHSGHGSIKVVSTSGDAGSSSNERRDEVDRAQASTGARC